MPHLLLTIALTAFSAAPQIENGTLLTFRGSMIAAKGDPVNTRKSFDLTIVVSDPTDVGATLFWTVKEEGRGSWPWPSSFDRWRVDGTWSGNGENGPSLLYDRLEALSVVRVVAPLLTPAKDPAKGVAWEQGGLRHQVTGSGKVQGVNSWTIDASNRFGHKRTLSLDKSSSVILAMKEIVFIGQGERHYVELELTGRTQMDAASLATFIETFERLETLRNKLGVEPQSKRVDWKDKQVATLKEELPPISVLAANGPLADVVKAALLDANDQKNRNVTIAAMEKQILGKKPADFAMESLTGKSVGPKDLKGSVAVLHFWQYRDKPLEEPYGQVGYLDFLSRSAGESVKVYGVTVDSRLSDTSTRRQAIQAAKRIKSFMNLSYPVLLDSGKVIRSFGDPRLAGAKLPLFVVVGKDGAVLHYHAGFYEVDRDRGLKELDEVVKTALKTSG